MNTQTSVFINIVRANVTPVDSFIVSRPIFDLQTIVRHCVEQNLVTSKRALKIYDEVARDWVRNAYATTHEDMHFDLESRFARVLDNVEEFIQELNHVNDEEINDVEYMLYQFFMLARLYSTLKSRSAISTEARELFANLTFQFIV